MSKKQEWRHGRRLRTINVMQLEVMRGHLASGFLLPQTIPLEPPGKPLLDENIMNAVIGMVSHAVLMDQAPCTFAPYTCSRLAAF